LNRPLLLYSITRVLAAAAAAAAAYPAYSIIADYVGGYLYNVTGPGLAVAAVARSLHVVGVLATIALVMLGRVYVAYAFLGIATGVAGLAGLEPWSVAVPAIASSILYTLSLRYEVASTGYARRRVLCSRQCVVATVASLLASYTVLATSVFYGSLLVSSLYELVLEPPAGLPEPLADAWGKARQMLVVRLLVLAVVAYVFYYAAARIIGPLVYALTASPEELAKNTWRLLETEAREVLEMRKWYHRMLRSSLALVGTIPAAVTGYIAVEAVSAVAREGLARGAPWWVDLLARILLVSSASTLSYLAARRLLESMAFARIRWRNLAIASAVGLTAWMLLYIAILVARGAQLGDALRVFLVNSLRVARGEEPLVSDNTQLLEAVDGLEKLLGEGLQQAEYILRLLVKLLWG